MVRLRQGRAEEGIALFRRAVEREPRNAETLLYLAGALASSGRPAEAIPYFERSIAAGPPSTMALNGLALTRLQLGDSKGAADAFRRSLAHRFRPARDRRGAPRSGPPLILADRPDCHLLSLIVVF